MKPQLVSAGCDPEVLFQCGWTGQLVSAHGFLPGTKDNPHPVRGGSVQVDNVCGEFNTHPVNTRSSFNAIVHDVYSQMVEMVGEFGLGPSPESVGEFEITEHSCVAGCDPDWNAYTLKLNPLPDYVNSMLRSAGGHLHLGVENIDRNDIPYLVKACDLLISAPMLRHEDPRRRRFYGRAGSFRLKPYGVEYRTPSNHWVFNADTREWVYQQMERAVATFKDLTIPDTFGAIIDEHRIDEIDTYLSQNNVDKYPL